MSDVYEEVRSHFENLDGIVVNSGKGAQGIKVNNKMYVMFSKGDLLIRLPPDRVDALVASGAALAYDPGTGKPMADRALVPASNRTQWISLAEESLAYGGWVR